MNDQVPRKQNPNFVTFVKRYQNSTRKTFFEVRLENSPRVRIPINLGKSQGMQIATIFDLQDGCLIPAKDVFMILEFSAGFIFEFTSPIEEVPDPARTAVLNEIVQNDENLEKMKTGTAFETDYGTFRPVEVTEKKEIDTDFMDEILRRVIKDLKRKEEGS